MKQAHLHDSRFKEVNDFSPRILTSLLPKYKLDIPEGAGSIRKSDSFRLDSDRVPPSEAIEKGPAHDRLEDRSVSKFGEGTIVHQGIYRVEQRKSEDFAARPTNMSGVGHILHQIEEPPASVARPVGRQLDFDSVPSVGDEAHASQIN